MWPQVHFVRMLFIGLAESKFEYPIPEWILTKLRHAFRGLCGTVGVEYLNRVLRKTENASNDSHEVCAEKQWYKTFLSSVVSDFGMRPLKITSASKQAAAKHLPKKCSSQRQSSAVLTTS